MNQLNREVKQEEIAKQERLTNTQIISLEPTKKQREIFCKEVLPNTEVKAREHNFLFTALTKLFKRTKELQDQEKQIQNEDIKEFITKSTQVKLLIEKLEEFKSRNPKEFGPNNFNLRSIYFNMTSKNLIIGLFFSISQSLLSCGCVFILDKITDVLKDYNGDSDQKTEVCLLLLAISVGYIFKNIFYSRYSWYQTKWQANAYATLQYLVFSKSLRTQVMSASSSNENGDSSGGSSDSSPDANNIMTVDVDQQQYIFWAFVQTIQSVITISIVLLLIYYRIGSSIFKGLYILLGSFFFNIIITQLMRIFYSRLYKKKDERVSLSKDVIDGMKSIKYLCWEEIFKKKIEKIRSQEMGIMVQTRILDGLLSIFWNCVSSLLLFFFLISFVNDGNDLKDSNVFTIIALFNLLTVPIGILPWTLGYMVKARVSYRRIKNFLNEKEIDHSNVVNLDLELNQRNATSPNSLVESFQENSQAQNNISQLAISIKKMKFDWPTKKSSKQIKMEEEQKKKQKKSKNKKEETIQDPLLANEIENSFEVKENNRFQLRVLDLTINKGDLSIIIGKIGSGKSALLHAILNELDLSLMDSQESLLASHIENSIIQERLTNYEKKIIINGRIGFVSQNHWLQNKTIKENILFGKEFDANWYNECIESCDLKVDFSTFQKRDEKVIGPGGGNLSGGQRQRIAICRALYQNCDIYLFDDIFSSLDAHVAEKVYQSVIVDVLIKKYKKTVLLVTSHFSIFSKREHINRIFYLQKGSIVYDQQEIEEFIKSGLSKEKEEEEAKKQKKNLEMNLGSDEQLEKENESDQQEEEIQTQGLQNRSLQKSQSADQIEEDLSLKKKQSSKHQNKIVDEEEETKKQQEEQREKGSIKLETFSTYIQSMSYIFLIIFILSSILMQGSSMLTDFWLRDQVSTSSSFFEMINGLFNSFTLTFMFFILLNLSMAISRALFYNICALRSAKSMFVRLNKSLIYSKMLFFDKNPPGRIVNRLSDDILNIEDSLPWSCQIFLKYFINTVGYPIGILIQLPWLVVFVIISIFFVYFIQRLFRLSNREIKRLNSVNSGRLLTNLGEACKGLILIRSFDRERFILKEYMEKLNDSVNTFLITEAIQIWMSIRLLFVSNFLFMCVAVTSMVLVGFNFDFDYITISMCLTYSMLLSSQFTDLIQFFCNVEQNLVSVERLRQYFNNDQENLDKIEFPQETIKQDEESHKIKDKNIAIEFENVYITYDEIKENTNISKDSTEVQFALKDICLQIRKGEKIAFCGRTGSGKTSILNTLFGMYPIQHGSIYVNGKNIKSYSLRDLRSKMSIIPQFGFLYNASLKDNLDPEGKIPRELMQQKINETNLKIRESNKKDKQKSENNEQSLNVEKVVINIPEQGDKEENKEENLDFEIEDGGQNLSNGEKQVVNFLRIILRETDIVCLDEATSNMDPKTDAELHKQIFKFAENRTLIVITHRLENIELFDKVAVLEKGKIVECGHVSELRKIEGGFFNRLLKNKAH